MSSQEEGVCAMSGEQGGSVRESKSSTYWRTSSTERTLSS